MDLTGVARAIDHAVYTLLNALAITLWRLNSGLLGISMFGYQTSDWLTGRDNEGVWYLFSLLVGPSGLVGVPLWSVFFAAALAIYGLSRIMRPFFQMRMVDISRLFFFAAVAYVFITQGSEMIQSAEVWRIEAGGWIYDAMADSNATLDVPGGGADEPIGRPDDLDGDMPTRGWEAVATSYFLVNSITELHQSVPPEEFRRTYCLYDPARSFDSQDDANAEGCSPRLAWDEWDQIQVTLPISGVLGLFLPEISIDMPIVQEHPENRQLGQRQAMAGVARLALGPIVALYPLVEAQVNLLLTMSAAFIYLSLPLVVLFSFFLPTESLFTRLILQFITIMIRTLILQGLVAIFLMLLISASVNGSLTSYVGLIGVGLAGGIFLIRMASATLKETMNQTIGSMSAIWTGAAAGTMGDAARRPAEAAFGAAKFVAAGAALGAGAMKVGMGGAMDMTAPAASVAQSGQRDIWGAQAKPTIIDKFAMEDTDGRNGVAPSLPSQLGSNWQSNNGVISNYPPPLASQAVPALTAETWATQWYQAAASGKNTQAVAASGEALLGENMGRATMRVMERRGELETQAVLSAARRAQMNGAAILNADGSVNPAGVQLVRQELPVETMQAFNDKQGRRDLTVLVVAGAQSSQRADPEAFRQVVSVTSSGQGQAQPARTIPLALGLDPVAAGADAAGLNHFSRMSEAAGLTQSQRERLLAETQTGDVSPELRQEIDAQVKQSPATAGIDTEALIAGAAALPETLTGPRRIHFGYQQPAPASVQAEKAEAPASSLAGELRRERRDERTPVAPKVTAPEEANEQPAGATVAPASVQAEKATAPASSLAGELRRERRDERTPVAPKVTAPEEANEQPAGATVAPASVQAEKAEAPASSLAGELRRERRDERTPVAPKVTAPEEANEQPAGATVAPASVQAEKAEAPASSLAGELRRERRDERTPVAPKVTAPEEANEQPAGATVAPASVQAEKATAPASSLAGELRRERRDERTPVAPKVTAPEEANEQPAGATVAPASVQAEKATAPASSLAGELRRERRDERTPVSPKVTAPEEANEQPAGATVAPASVQAEKAEAPASSLAGELRRERRDERTPVAPKVTAPEEANEQPAGATVAPASVQAEKAEAPASSLAGELRRERRDERTPVAPKVTAPEEANEQPAGATVAPASVQAEKAEAPASSLAGELRRERRDERTPVAPKVTAPEEANEQPAGATVAPASVQAEKAEAPASSLAGELRRERRDERTPVAPKVTAPEEANEQPAGATVAPASVQAEKAEAPASSLAGELRRERRDERTPVAPKVTAPEEANEQPAGATVAPASVQAEKAEAPASSLAGELRRERRDERTPVAPKVTAPEEANEQPAGATVAPASVQAEKAEAPASSLAGELRRERRDERTPVSPKVTAPEEANEQPAGATVAPATAAPVQVTVHTEKGATTPTLADELKQTHHGEPQGKSPEGAGEKIGPMPATGAPAQVPVQPEGRATAPTLADELRQERQDERAPVSSGVGISGTNDAVVAPEHSPAPVPGRATSAVPVEPAVVSPANVSEAVAHVAATEEAGEQPPSNKKKEAGKPVLPPRPGKPAPAKGKGEETGDAPAPSSGGRAWFSVRPVSEEVVERKGKTEYQKKLGEKAGGNGEK